MFFVIHGLNGGMKIGDETEKPSGKVEKRDSRVSQEILHPLNLSSMYIL